MPNFTKAQKAALARAATQLDVQPGIISTIAASGTPVTSPREIVGDLAQTSVGQNYQVTGSITSGSESVTGVSSITGLAVGQLVTGTGIAPGTTITAVAAGTITLSAAVTATAAAAALNVIGESQTFGLMEWEISWKLDTVASTTTDNAGYKSFLPSNAEWTVTAKFAYLLGDTSQTNNVRSIITALQRTTQRWNFFMAPEAGDDSFYGNAFIDSIKFGAGGGKIVGMDVTLKGSGPLYIAPTLAPTPSSTVTGLQAQN